MAMIEPLSGYADSAGPFLGLRLLEIPYSAISYRNLLAFGLLFEVWKKLVVGWVCFVDEGFPQYKKPLSGQGALWPI